ncbi:hypothetical protein D9M69_656840 [compost metagenome]
MGVVGGRDELGLAHGAGPGTEHLFGFDVALLQDLQGRDQLRVGEAGTAAFVGQGRQRVDHRLAALELAKIAFHAPHGHQRLTINAITLLDALQDVGVLVDQ